MYCHQGVTHSLLFRVRTCEKGLLLLSQESLHLLHFKLNLMP